MDKLEEMFVTQHLLQVAFECDPYAMTQDERLAYIRMNALGLIDEVMEALNECGWKSWSTSNHINDDKMFGELRDAWQFLMNLMITCSDDPTTAAERLTTELLKKQQVNYQRMIDKYDGVSTKCECGRALDDPQVTSAYRVTNVSDLVSWQEVRCICGHIVSSDRRK